MLPDEKLARIKGKQARKAIKKVRRKLRKALRVNTLNKLACCIGMASIGVRKTRTILKWGEATA